MPNGSRSERSTLEMTPLAGVALLRAHYVDHRFDRHAHDTYCLGVTLSGIQTFFCRGGQHASTAGQIMAFNPDDPHDGHSGGAGGFQYRMLYIQPEVVGKLLEARHAPFFAQPVSADPHSHQLILNAVDAIQPRESLRAQTLLSRALQEVFGRHGKAHLRQISVGRRDARASRLRDFLEASIARDITGDELAALIGCSRIHVNRIFQRAYGLPPHAYLNSARLRHACRLMQSGITIAEAAAASGFADQAHMSRRFKRIYGVTPARWLRAVRPL